MYQWIDCEDYWEFDAPQKDEKWEEVKIGRTSGSNTGALGGLSKFKTPEEAGLYIAGAKREEFDKEATERMAHGNLHEDNAKNWFISKTGLNVVDRGLIVPKWDVERLGVSVDGDIYNTPGMIEIKCPVKMYKPLRDYLELMKGGWVPMEGYRGHIYPTHYAQMQQGMAILGKRWCEYIVYSTSDGEVFTQTVPFNQEFWDEHYNIIKKNYDLYVKPYLPDGYPIMPK